MSDEKKTIKSFFRFLWTEIKKIVCLILNPRFLLCFGLAWIITNGWAYILFWIGAWLNIGWMSAVSGAYLAFIWFPITPEKIVTTGISILLLKKLFPNDEKTLGVLRGWHEKARSKWEKMKLKRENKRKR